MRAFVFLAVFASLAIGFAAPRVGAQIADASIGTWALNLAQSSYDPPSLAPRSQTTRIIVAGDTFTMVTEGVDAEGKKTRAEITYKFDGKEYEYKGAPDANTTRIYTRVDDHHYTFVTKVNGLITTTSRVAVTSDGKTRTITTTGRDAQGRVIRNFAVWNKVG